MNIFCILPDKQQTGAMLVYPVRDGRVISEEAKPLRERFDLSGFPPSCELTGVPNIVLEQHDIGSFVFSQIARTAYKDYFLRSCAAGKDRDGRNVFLVLIFECEKGELERLSPSSFCVAETLFPEEGISEKLMLLNQGAPEEKAMFTAFKQNKGLKHFTACSLEGLFHRADWEDGWKKEDFQSSSSQQEDISSSDAAVPRERALGQ